MRLQSVWRTISFLTPLLLVAPAVSVPAQAASAKGISTAPVSAESPVAYPAHPLPYDRGAVALWQTLQKLRTRASLLMITAHPDDEDGSTLTYESRGAGTRTNLLSLTRGEGGQNVMSSDSWDALGLVRTEELLSADRYYDTHQYWSRVADFGFSKTKDESLSRWGYDRVLYDCVRVVRMTRPLVVMSVFAGNVSDGHGQHQVSGQMAQEVYKAAGDPSVFPDQIRAGLKPWSPLKVYIRVPFADVTNKGVHDYATGHWAPAIFHNYVTNTDIIGKPKPTVEIPIGNYSPVLGLSYFQLARLGLGQQKTQHDGVGLPLAQPLNSSYHLYASRVAASPTERTFYDGIDVSLTGIADLAPAAERSGLRARLSQISGDVDAAQQTFSIDHPERTVPSLTRGLASTRSLIAEVGGSRWSDAARYNVQFELRQKESQFSRAIAEALGISLQAMVTPNPGPSSTPIIFRGYAPTFRVAIPGQKFFVLVHISDGSSIPVKISDVQLASPTDNGQDTDIWRFQTIQRTESDLAAGQATDAIYAVEVPQHPAFTRPYFQRPDVEQPYYDIADPRYLNRSQMPYPLHAIARLSVDGVSFQLRQTVETVQRSSGHGAVFQPLIVAPAISVSMAPSTAILPLGAKSLQVTASLSSQVKGPATGKLTLELPDGWSAQPPSATFSIANDGDLQSFDFTVTPNNPQSKTYTIRAVADYAGQPFNDGFRMTGYAGVRPYPIYRAATTSVRAADVRVAPHLRVGYITGTGDEVPEALRELGVEVETVSTQQIAAGDLSQFDAIVLGIRAYSVRPELKAYNDRLMNYVHQGGVLIVQYHTADFDSYLAPYPLTLGGNPEKVIDEHSTMKILQASNPLLIWPNHITTSDFQGWIEERGHGFLRSWDARYTPLLETHDPGQDPQQGGLIYTRYGKGIYVYDAYALYRQLPEGVPGAFRLFANLVSLSKNPGLH